MSTSGCVVRTQLLVKFSFAFLRLIFPLTYRLTHPTKMPSLSALIKVFFKNLDLLKGIAVRSRCPATCSGDSFARTASDMTQIISPVVQATIAGAIPVAGPPIQATISGLLPILQAIYVRVYFITGCFLIQRPSQRRSQNKADIDCLRTQLQRLSSHLWNAPTAQDPSEQHRREVMIKYMLS